MSESRTVLFQPIEPGDLDSPGVSPSHQLAHFSALVRDVTEGVDTLLAIAERDAVDSMCEDDGKPIPALLNEYHHGTLTRLSRATLGMLAREADQVLGRVRSATTPGRRWRY